MYFFQKKNRIKLQVGDKGLVFFSEKKKIKLQVGDKGLVFFQKKKIKLQVGDRGLVFFSEKKRESNSRLGIKDLYIFIQNCFLQSLFHPYRLSTFVISLRVPSLKQHAKLFGFISVITYRQSLFLSGCLQLSRLLN